MWKGGEAFSLQITSIGKRMPQVQMQSYKELGVDYATACLEPT